MMRVLVVITVMLVGCGPSKLPGAPEPGSNCSATMPECISDSEVGYCESSKWAKYNCPGECGNAQDPRCNWRLAGAGDACPKAIEGTGFCSTSARLLRCDRGRFVATECPNGCVEQGTSLECRP